MTSYKLVFILTLATLSQVSYYVDALNILAIVSLPLKSHYMAFHNLFRELAIRGHAVTVVNNFPEENPPPSLKFINLNAVKLFILPRMLQFENFNPFYSQLHNFFRQFLHNPTRLKQDCETLFTNNELKLLYDKGDKFDVIFVEQFLSDCGLMYAAALYDAPIIGITSHTLLPWGYPRLGIPFDAGSNAFYFSSAGTNPSVYQKVESYLLHLFMNTVMKLQAQRTIYEAFEKYLPKVSLDLEALARDKMKMMFVYQHHSVTGARLLPPQLLEIGGIHIAKTKPLPEKLEKFITSAKHGVVYFSFGSNLPAHTMSKNKMEQFLLAFKKIPQKVLWKLDNVTLPSGNDNVLTSNWFPQLDILCHSNVLAFVSHGGMLSLSEAAHCGKPLLTMPFFGDQFSNLAAVVESGLGSIMYFQYLNADNLAEAIKNLTSLKMQKSAKRVSKLWHDRPMNVLDSAIYWTEYVARHKSAPPPLAAKTRSWFQNTLLDVYSSLIVILVVLFSVVYVIFRINKFIFLLGIGLLFIDNNKSKQEIKRKRA